jgi:predicted ArsR family transcriptional regulator
MKINYDYLKKLLETFASSDKAVIDYNVLKSATLTADANTFLFHLQQVEDEGCIERADKKPGLGYVFSMKGDGITWAVVPLRMTSSGFQLLDALRNKDILNTLKTEFKDDSLRTIRTIAKQLLENYRKKKTAGLWDELP